MTIYYFTGTGNSLFAAKKLAETLDNVEIVPMLSVLHQLYQISTNTIIMVFPTYVTSIPKPVKQFIESLDPQVVKSVYAVATHCGFPGKVDWFIEYLLNKRHIQLKGYTGIEMVGNTPTGLMPKFMFVKDWDQLVKNADTEIIDLNMSTKLLDFSTSIKSNQNYVSENMKLVGFKKLMTTMTQVPFQKMNHTGSKNIKFIADDACIACGKCAKLCPSNKISIIDGSPSWDKSTDCYYCYGCFNLCPKHAISVKGYDEKTVRYHHPKISYDEILSQKQSITDV